MAWVADRPTTSTGRCHTGCGELAKLANLKHIRVEKIHLNLFDENSYLIEHSEKDDEDGVVLQDYLKSGVLRNLVSYKLIIQFDVIEAITGNFQRNPDEYTEGTLKIRNECHCL